MDTGTIIITEREDNATVPQKVAIYARVSSPENKANLERQAERLTDYCIAKGYQVSKIVKETASGLNDNRPKFISLLADETVTTIVVEHKDRATRFGFNYIKILLESRNRTIEVVNLADNGKEDLMQDLISIIYSFSARLYGKRKAKRKTSKAKEAIEND